MRYIPMLLLGIISFASPTESFARKQGGLRNYSTDNTAGSVHNFNEGKRLFHEAKRLEDESRRLITERNRLKKESDKLERNFDRQKNCQRIKNNKNPSTVCVDIKTMISDISTINRDLDQISKDRTTIENDINILWGMAIKIDREKATDIKEFLVQADPTLQDQLVKRLLLCCS